MDQLQPDPRHIKLAAEYKSPWREGTVVTCSNDSITLDVDRELVTYALSVLRSPFPEGCRVEICADWSLVRQGRRHAVVLPADGQLSYPRHLSPALPPGAQDWSAAARAGWLYGYQQWLWNEDWIDVSFAELRDGDDDDDFEGWAHQAYIEMHRHEGDEAEDDEEDDEEDGSA
jgi:hypothetical protein